MSWQAKIRLLPDFEILTPITQKAGRAYV